MSGKKISVVPRGVSGRDPAPGGCRAPAGLLPVLVSVCPAARGAEAAVWGTAGWHGARKVLASSAFHWGNNGASLEESKCALAPCHQEPCRQPQGPSDRRAAQICPATSTGKHRLKAARGSRQTQMRRVVPVLSRWIFKSVPFSWSSKKSCLGFAFKFMIFSLIFPFL